MILEIYKYFGFSNIKINYADRPKKRVGKDDIWDKSEEALLKAVKKAGVEYEINKGEGAFYGPKIEFVIAWVVFLNRASMCSLLNHGLSINSRISCRLWPLRLALRSLALPCHTRLGRHDRLLSQPPWHSHRSYT